MKGKGEVCAAMASGGGATVLREASEVVPGSGRLRAGKSVAREALSGREALGLLFCRLDGGLEDGLEQTLIV